MPQLSRQQVIAWIAVAAVVLLIGANYLRSHIGSRAPESASVVTVGLTQTRAAAPIKVYVTGAVVYPGLYEFHSGDRIADALSRAGGPAADAELALLNLAAKLTDGQQVVVPAKGQAPAAGAGAPGGGMDAGGGGGAGDAGAGSGSGQAGAAAGPLDLNSATAIQLESLNGVGPKTAQKIVEYREANGGFKSVEELMEVPGIGPAKFEQIRGQVFV